VVTVLIASCFTAVTSVFDMVELTIVDADVESAPVVATVTSSLRTFVSSAAILLLDLEEFKVGVYDVHPSR
jgi:hypothetical protein